MKPIINENQQKQELKKCSSCKQLKQKSEYTKNKSNKDGISHICRLCRKENRKNNYTLEKSRKSRESSKNKNIIRFRCNQFRNNTKKRTELPLPCLDDLENLVRTSLPNGCSYTKKELTGDDFGIDHKIPLKRGGTNDIKNLCVVDQKINKAKGNMTDKEFLSLLKVISKWEDGGESLLSKLRAANTIFRR